MSSSDHGGSGLRTRRLGDGLGWFVVQEVTGHPVHQLGFQSPATAKSFEHHLAGQDLDWRNPHLGADRGVTARILWWRITWLFLCVDDRHPVPRRHYSP
jgi:hypothetical protein